MFEVRGSFGKGFVSAELYLQGGSARYRSLTVTHAASGKRLLLEGDALPAFRVLLNNESLLKALVAAEEHVPEVVKYTPQAVKYTH